MLRSRGTLNFNACLEDTLRERVQSEAGVSIQTIDRLVPLDRQPPIIGRYTIRGHQQVSASIVPYYGETEIELPTYTEDPTVYSVGWYNPLEIMPEVTQTNALILAHVFWSQWSISEQETITPILLPHLDAVRKNAEFFDTMPPSPPWDTKM